MYIESKRNKIASFHLNFETWLGNLKVSSPLEIVYDFSYLKIMFKNNHVEIKIIFINYSIYDIEFKICKYVMLRLVLNGDRLFVEFRAIYGCANHHA